MKIITVELTDEAVAILDGKFWQQGGVETYLRAEIDSLIKDHYLTLASKQLESSRVEGVYLQESPLKEFTVADAVKELEPAEEIK